MIPTGERRRVRLRTMANELEVSERIIRQLLSEGMPHTALHGIIWFEPIEVHEWLDHFHCVGRRRGFKRMKGLKVADQNGTDDRDELAETEPAES